jgi:hypothetical protein
MNALLWYAPFIQLTSCITRSLFAIICLLSHFQQVTAASMATCSDNEIMNIMFLHIAALKKKIFFSFLFSSGLKNITNKEKEFAYHSNE